MIRFIPIKDDIEKVYIIMNDIIIGKLNYYVTKNIIKINYILIFNEYRKCGLGKDVVRYLIKTYPDRDIHGDALPEAICFWEKMGVEFYDPFPSKIKPEILLTPFKLGGCYAYSS